ncbi:MAG: AIR synthase-related protein, partial [Dehalococcoidia bacterium]|nr:AIR synthase-related protein [Dehalococcoidia bacterium]
YANMEYLKDNLRWDDSVSPEARIVLCDAQTSGGLLISVPVERSQALLDALAARRVRDVAVIGEILEGPAGVIEVEP